MSDRFWNAGDKNQFARDPWAAKNIMEDEFEKLDAELTAKLVAKQRLIDELRWELGKSMLAGELPMQTRKEVEAELAAAKVRIRDLMDQVDESNAKTTAANVDADEWCNAALKRKVECAALRAYCGDNPYHSDWKNVDDMRAHIATLRADNERQSKRLPDFFREVFGQEFPGDHDALMLAKHCLSDLRAEVESASRRSEYWKQEHSAANVEIERLTERCTEARGYAMLCRANKLVDAGTCDKWLDGKP